MKKTIFALIASIVLASCGTSRKAARDKTEHVIDSTGTAITRNESSDTFVDTTRTQTGEIVITEIEFYPPDMEDADSSKRPSVADVELPGTGRVKGSIKRITQTQVKQKDERRGQSKESSVSDESKTNAAVKRRDTDEHKESTPVADPFRWRYIAFIVAVIVAAVLFLYLKRQPFVRVIRNFITRIRGFLK